MDRATFADRLLEICTLNLHAWDAHEWITSACGNWFSQKLDPGRSPGYPTTAPAWRGVYLTSRRANETLNSIQRHFKWWNYLHLAEFDSGGWRCCKVSMCKFVPWAMGFTLVKMLVHRGLYPLGTGTWCGEGAGSGPRIKRYWSPDRFMKRNLMYRQVVGTRKHRAQVEIGFGASSLRWTRL